MKKFFGSICVILLLVVSTGLYAQDSTGSGSGNTGSETGNTGTGTTGSGTGSGVNETGTQGQQQTGTTNSQSIQNDDQQYGTNADDWSQSLSDELSLNASQRDSVRSILLDYQKQRAMQSQDMSETELSQFNSTYNDRIMNILEDNQVNSYKSYNQGWWNDINSRISNTDKNNMDKKQQY